MSYLKDREIWLSNVPTGNPPTGYFWKFIQNGKVVVRDSSGNNQIMVATSGSQAITGSLTVTGGITGTISSASYVEYSNVANKPTLVSGSAQVTYSGLTGIPSGIVSGSAQIASFGIFATTGSNGFNGNQSITGSLTVTGQVVAQTLNVQQVTSSVVFSSGSNVFGNSLSNTQQFTGSVGMTGSLTVTTNGVELQVTNTGVNLGNALTDSHIISGSLRINPNGLFVSGSGNVGIGTISPSARLHTETSTNADGIYLSRSTSNKQAIFISADDSVGAYITGGTTPAGNGTQGDGAGRLIIQGGSTEGFQFQTSAAAINVAQNWSTKMVIKNNGNVGIGVTSLVSPGSSRRLLQISNSTNGALIALGSSTSESNNPRIFSGQFDLGFAAGVTTGNIDFYTNDSLRMRITSGGNVGIGVTPNAWATSNDVRAIQLKAGTFWNYSDFSTYFGLNYYWDGSVRKYIISDYASEYQQILGEHRWFSAPSGTAGNTATFTERMRITSDGNVGIGIDSPNAKLNILYDKNARFAGQVIFDSQAFNVSNIGGNITFGGRWNSGGDLTEWASIGGVKSNATSGNFAGDLVLYSRPNGGGMAERMRITSVGFLKASNTGTYISSGAAYHEILSNVVDDWAAIIRNTSASPYGLQISYNSSPNSTANQFIWCPDGTALRFEVRSNGGIGNYQANNVNLSDERTKKDISPLESYWDKFKVLEIVKFKYKDQTHDDFNIGVIAQQVEEVAPEFVDVDGWDTKPKLDEEGNEIISTEEPLKSIYTADLYHATIKVLQEAMSKIEEQQTLIESLKSRIEILEQ